MRNNRIIQLFSESESESDNLFNDINLIFPSKVTPINFFGDNPNDIIDENQNPPNKNNFEPLNNVNKSESKKEIFIVIKPNLDVIKGEEESEKSKDNEIYYINVKKGNTNMDDSLSTINQTQNRKEKKDFSNKKKFISKKRKRSDSENSHDKYSYDNILKKCKFIVLKNVRNFINNKIKELFNYNIGNGIYKKHLFTINKKQTSNANIDFNKSFMKKKLVDIFSENLTTKIKKFKSNKNGDVIKNLMNEKDENKREYFNKLFNLNFIDCLNHFINKESIKELNGLKLFDEMINDIKMIKDFNLEENDEEYFNQLKYYFVKYEEELNKRKGRIPK